MTPARPMVVLELQEAVQTRLTSDGVLSGMITGVFDAVRTGQAMPYISYGDHVSETFATFGGHWNGQVHFMMDIWSQARGKEECYRILAEVIRIVVTTQENPPLALAHYQPATVQFDWSTTLYEADFSLWHLPTRFLVRAFEV